MKRTNKDIFHFFRFVNPFLRRIIVAHIKLLNSSNKNKQLWSDLTNNSYYKVILHLAFQHERAIFYQMHILTKRKTENVLQAVNPVLVFIWYSLHFQPFQNEKAPQKHILLLYKCNYILTKIRCRENNTMSWNMSMAEKQHNNTKLMLLHRFFSFLSVYRTKSNPIMSGQMQIVCATALQPYNFKI